MATNAYHLVDPTHRSSVVLSDYSSAIKKAVSCIRPSAVVTVYNSFFEINTLTDLTDGERRSIGRRIAQNSSDLNSLKRPHSNGYHLFKRK
ncbi:hypothetical protein V7124_19770 [Neobacillus niacini]|uniref:hypothetical protein n=1 Tax=Neobacillus niacini TaxID=86668 RepID=UPI0030003DB2